MVFGRAGGGELPEIGSAGRRGAGRAAWACADRGWSAAARPAPARAARHAGGRAGRGQVPAPGACALRLARQADVAGPCGRSGPEAPVPGPPGAGRRLAVAYCLVMAARTAGWNLRMNVQMLQRACHGAGAGAGAAAVTEGEYPPDTVAMRRAQIADYERDGRRASSRWASRRLPSSGSPCVATVARSGSEESLNCYASEEGTARSV
jgi:hypothetical protein